jgi:glycerate dehydrogenase
MQTIVFLDRQTVAADFRSPKFPHHWIDHPASLPAETAGRLAEAQIAITNKVRITEDVLAQAPRLKLVVASATGTDHIDLKACAARGIRVANIRGYSTDGVAEHVFALILALRKQLIGYHADVRSGRWRDSGTFALIDRPIHNLAGSTLGLVGYGAIGRRVEGIAKAFGMRVLLADRKGAAELRPGRLPFAEVLAAADVLSLHTPLTPETAGLIGAPELAQMKRTALLINTGRGGLVDAEALAAALREGKIGGAGVDVLAQEPPPAGHPLVETTLANLIATPHNAWASRESMQVLADQMIDVLEAFVAGEPINIVV